MDLVQRAEAFIALRGKEDQILLEISQQKDTQEFIIKTMQDQLFESGEDGNGESLGEYSATTTAIKRRKGQPTDRITLKDTGFFYSTYSIEPFEGGFVISANGKVSPGVDLLVRYGEDILKPNVESLLKFRDWYVIKIKEYVKNTLDL